MDETIKSFHDYRTEKRLEITTMHTIIHNLEIELRDKDKTLLIASYIVLTYAYWESCFHKFQHLLFLKYKTIPIKDLPFSLKKLIYLELAKQAFGSNRNKTIQEIKNHEVFDSLQREMHKYDEFTISSIDNSNKFSHIFLDETQNPNISLMNTLLKKYHINLHQILSTSEIGNFFEKGLSFIISQRNSIAHRNETIFYNERPYSDFHSCFNDFKNNENLDLQITTIEDFIKEMTFQINLFFNVLVDNIIQRGSDNV